MARDSGTGSESLAVDIDHARLYRLLVQETTSYAVFLVDLSGTIITWNAGVQHILGYQAREFVSKSVAILYSDDEWSNGIPKGELAAAVRDDGLSDRRWQHRKDGSRLYAAHIFSVVRNEIG